MPAQHPLCLPPLPTSCGCCWPLPTPGLLAGLAPAEFKAGLFSSDAARKQELIKLAQELQHLLSTYNGLMSVSLAAPSATLEILDLLVDLTPAQAAALQRRVKA